jgi:hypothetical protein
LAQLYVMQVLGYPSPKSRDLKFLNQEIEGLRI